MYMYVCAQLRVPYYIIYVRRGLSVAVCYKGNTRASECGTARLQSRFYFCCGSSISKIRFFDMFMIFDILDYRKNSKKFAYVKKKQYLCSKF